WRVYDSQAFLYDGSCLLVKSIVRSKMSISFSYCWLYGGVDDRGLGLEGWLRIVVDGCNQLVGLGRQKGDGSRLLFRVDSLRFRLLLVLQFKGAVEVAKDFCSSGLRLGRRI
ncbi:hypothetical protein BHE74_00046921, partial [Ensete ventricosum]